MVHGQAKRRRTHSFRDVSPTSHNVPLYHTSKIIGTIEVSLPFSFIMLLPPLLVLKTNRGIVHSLMLHQSCKFGAQLEFVCPTSFDTRALRV